MSLLFQTGRLIVRKPVPGDAWELFQNYTRDPAVTKYLTWRPHQSIDDTTAWIDFCIADWQREKDLRFVIWHKEQQTAIGMLEFNLDGFKAHFGYVLARSWWNRGIMTEAMQPVMDWVFRKPEIYRIWAIHDPENGASGRVMEKLGMQYEGIVKRFIILPNISAEPRDCKMYALVK